jgi:hypothetical protein
MERGNPRFGFEGQTGEMRSHPLAHLVGGFIGKRDCQNRGRRHTPCHDDVGNAMRNDPRLAAPGPGQDQKGAFGEAYGFPLLRIETLEEIHEIPRCFEFNTQYSILFVYLALWFKPISAAGPANPRLKQQL